jgi:2-polyprenyl-3-methyl-5-hydroxy-6-metoxy-1,4-benzoquinol methylase
MMAVVCEPVGCSLCNSRSRTLLLSGPDRWHGVPGTFTLYRCAACGLIYQTPRPTAESFAAIYPADYIPHSADSRAEYIPHPDTVRACKFINRWQPAGHTLLDIGCGSGGLLRAMRTLAPHWHLMGLEPDAEAAATARSYGLNVQPHRLEDARLTRDTWDAITLWNVLEHLPDPLSTLRHVRTLLAPGGVAYLAVPMADSLDARIFGDSWIGWDLPRHFVLFERPTLRAMLAQAGLEIIATECNNGIEFCFSESIRWLLRDRIANPTLRQLSQAATYTRPFRLAVHMAMRPVVAQRRCTVLSVAARPRQTY